MEIGFTGSRHGITGAQNGKLVALLIAYWMPGNRLHHGDCTGADEAAFSAGLMLGYDTIAYPATNVAARWHAKTASTERVEGYEAMARNDLIVHNTWVLIGTPNSKPSAENVRSGTWATIRRAQKANHPVWIIDPYGNAEFFPVSGHQMSAKVTSFNWSDA